MAMCDLAVASEGAVFGLPEVNVGLFPAQVLSVLQHLLPRRRLTELCLCGEPISAREALAAGLVNYVSDDLDAELGRLLARMLNNRPPLSAADCTRSSMWKPCRSSSPWRSRKAR